MDIVSTLCVVAVMVNVNAGQGANNAEMFLRGPVTHDELIRCPGRFCHHVSYECGLRCQANGTDCDLDHCKGYYHCIDGSAIPMSKLCDGRLHCGHSEDEVLCTKPFQPRCICSGLTISCNASVEDDGTFIDVPEFTNTTLIPAIRAIVPAAESFDLNYLLLTKCAVGDLFLEKQVLLKGLLSVLFIDLSSNDISVLPASIFKGLSTLRVLNLHDNYLSTLPANLFSDLSNLHYLFLDNNTISTVPSNAFSALTKLRILFLHNNDISKLDSNLFNGLSLLYILSLSGNEISTLPDTIFSGMYALAHLYLDDNNISALTSNIFSDLSHLTHLYLYNNKISQFSDTTFRKLSSLKYLILVNNSISSFPAFPFKKSYNLTHLYLDSNEISTLPDGTFFGLVNLTNLYLHNNVISSIPENAFSGLSKLSHLFLHNNNLSTIHASSFRGLSSLVYLFLHNNTLPTVPGQVFNGLSRLGVLYLHKNKISILPAGTFSGLTNLVVLSLHENTISTLPQNIFSGLSRLIVLYLFNTKMTTLPANVFRSLSSLHVLYLHNNKISNLVANVFKGLHSLKELYVLDNRISSISPNAFNSDLHLLTILYLHNNTIPSLPDKAFNGLINVRLMTLHDNKIATLPTNAFSDLFNLIYLDLSNNQLMQLPTGLFINNGQLKYLRIEGNKIKAKGWMFDGLYDLEFLSTDSELICCVKPTSVEECALSDDLACEALPNCTKTTKTKEAISSCRKLIESDGLKVCLWIIGICALVGNAYVILYHILSDRENIKKPCFLFVFNLGISDSFMGMYLLIIGAVDAHYNKIYGWNSVDWKTSTLCTTAGIFATVSSEMSIFIILMVTIERFIAIVFPLSQWHITWKQALGVSVILWILAFTIAFIPQFSLQAYFKGEFYSQSALCLSLPLTIEHRPWENYSFAFFVCVNSSIFLIILLPQIWIFKSLISSAQIDSSIYEKQENAVAKTLFCIVASDFVCWFAIGIMGVMARSGTKIPPELYAWVMVVVLPINAAINPFLYAVTYIWRQQRNDSRCVTLSDSRRSSISETTNTAI